MSHGNKAITGVIVALSVVDLVVGTSALDRSFFLSLFFLSPSLFSPFLLVLILIFEIEIWQFDIRWLVPCQKRGFQRRRQ